MPSVTLLWIGDLNQDKKMENSSKIVSDERNCPPFIELKENQKEVRIGRQNSTKPPDYLIESCINKRMISRTHASIERLSDDGFMLYDHSINGTYVNYTRVSGGVILKPGDIVCFGHLNGANLKPGEDVSPFFSDLKYKVYLCPSSEVKDLEKTTASFAGFKRRRKPSPPVQKTSTKKPDGDLGLTISGNPLTKEAKLSNPSKSRRVDDSEKDLEPSKAHDTSSKRKSAVSSSGSHPPKLSNGNDSVKSCKKLSNSLPEALLPTKKITKPFSTTHKPSVNGSHQSRQKDKKSDLTHSANSKKSKITRPVDDDDAELDSEQELYHYDTEECSARPCKKPQDVSIDWIQCDKCSKWYHQVCLGLSAEEADVEVYFCPYCKKK